MRGGTSWNIDGCKQNFLGQTAFTSVQIRSEGGRDFMLWDTGDVYCLGLAVAVFSCVCLVSACLSLCQPACLSLSACLSVCLSLCQPACLSVSVSACLCVSLPVCLCLPVCQPVCLSACQSLSFYVSVSACLSVAPPPPPPPPRVCVSVSVPYSWHTQRNGSTDTQNNYVMSTVYCDE